MSEFLAGAGTPATLASEHPLKIMNDEICKCEYCQEEEVLEMAEPWTDLPEYDKSGEPSE